MRIIDTVVSYNSFTNVCINELFDFGYVLSNTAAIIKPQKHIQVKIRLLQEAAKA